MNNIFTLLLIVCALTAYAQEENKEIESILLKLDKLEKLKLENGSVSTIQVISDNDFYIDIEKDSFSDNAKTNEFENTETIEIIDTNILQAIISFDTSTYQIGTITQGDIVKKTFIFTNIGTDNLELINVIPDCSCTSPKWSTEIIKPQKQGFITVTYDSHDDVGKFLKTITVLHNSGEGYTFLELKGFVSQKL